MRPRRRLRRAAVALSVFLLSLAISALQLTELFGAPARTITGAYMWVLPVPPPAG
jgi:hypothetical protein